MKKVTLSEMRQLQLRILDCIHEYCMANNIRYSLGGGSLLGAIRHKGFIPWDDDVDVMMPRSDYERFISGFCGKYEHCIVHHWRYDKAYNNLFAKVYDDRTILQERNIRTGVYVDVFPLDGLPPIERHKKYHIEYMIKTWFGWIWTTPFKNRTWKLKLFTLIFFPLGFLRNITHYQEYAEDFMMKYDFDSSECAGCVVGTYGMKEYMSGNTFRKYIDVDFEGRKLKAIAAYDDYLAKHYGDYMKWPPKEEQISRHTYKCWWK